MQRRSLGHLAAVFIAAAVAGFAPFAQAADEAPDVMIKRLSEETLGAIKADKSIKTGDISKVIVLVDGVIVLFMQIGALSPQTFSGRGSQPY